MIFIFVVINVSNLIIVTHSKNLSKLGRGSLVLIQLNHFGKLLYFLILLLELHVNKLLIWTQLDGLFKNLIPPELFNMPQLFGLELYINIINILVPFFDIRVIGMFSLHSIPNLLSRGCYLELLIKLVAEV